MEKQKVFGMNRKKIKVLWFTNTPSLYDQDNHHYHGGGWIESLESIIVAQNNLELAISFFSKERTKKVFKNDVYYYPIKRKTSNKLSLGYLINNWKGNLDDDHFIDDFLKVIEDFKPDIINVFGTEGPFGLLKNYTKIPVVVHIQGLINPCVNAFFPGGVSSRSILFSKNYFLRNLIGSSPYFQYKKFCNLATREIFILKNIEYVFGRTEWDRNITKLINPKVKYFHIEEVLRPVFYSEVKDYSNIIQVSRNQFIILSTISSTTYKGIDVIIKTARILKSYSNFNFEWRVIGVDKDNSLVNFLESKLQSGAANFGVHFLGVLNQQELISEMKSANIFVHPSYIDNSPNSVCEAQMIGLPVIACNVGGVSTLIQNSHTGILVPSNGIFEIVNELICMQANPDKLKLLGESGREFAQQRHNRSIIAINLLNAYKAILNI